MTTRLFVQGHCAMANACNILSAKLHVNLKYYMIQNIIIYYFYHYNLI